MKNIEKFASRIAKTDTTEEGLFCFIPSTEEIRGCNELWCHKCAFYDGNCMVNIVNWLNQPYEEARYLTPDEHSFLLTLPEDATIYRTSKDDEIIVRSNYYSAPASIRIIGLHFGKLERLVMYDVEELLNWQIKEDK